MSNQTSVELRIANATPGLIADINDYKAISKAAENGPIAFGVVVGPGSTGNQAVPGGTPANGIFGVTIRSTGKEPVNVGSTTLEYQDTEAMAIMTEGYIYVTCPSGASFGDAVTFTDADGVIDAGLTGAGTTTIDNARWDANVTAGQVGRIYISDVLGLTAGA